MSTPNGADAPAWELWHALLRSGHTADQAAEIMNNYAHWLADRQRNWDAEAAGYTDPQMAVYAVADLIDPEVSDR